MLPEIGQKKWPLKNGPLHCHTLPYIALPYMAAPRKTAHCVALPCIGKQKQDSDYLPKQQGFSCDDCCFFRIVELKSRKLRRICMLLGEKRPWAGMDGCNFIPGQWSQIDRILGLPSLDFSGNTGDPNLTELGNCFSRNGRKFAKKDIFAIDDSIGFPIIIQKRKAVVRPGVCEAPVAR